MAASSSLSGASTNALGVCSPSLSRLSLPTLASRSETFDGVEWRILAAGPADIQARNLCRDADETANLDISEDDGALRVVYQSDAEGPGSTSCVFLLIGDTKALT